MSQVQDKTEDRKPAPEKGLASRILADGVLDQVAGGWIEVDD